MAGRSRDVPPLSGWRPAVAGCGLRRGGDGGRGLPLPAAAPDGTGTIGGGRADPGRRAGRLDRLGGTAPTSQRALLLPPPARATRVPGRPAARVDAATVHLALGEPAFGVPGWGHHQRAVPRRRSRRRLAVPGR